MLGDESSSLGKEGGKMTGGDSCARTDHGVWSLAFTKCQGGAGVLRDAAQRRSRSSLAFRRQPVHSGWNVGSWEGELC